MPRIRFDEIRVDYEVSSGNISLYERADNKIGRDMLNPIAQIPEGRSRMGPANMEVKKFLWEYFKDRECSRIKVSLAHLTYGKESAFYFDFVYETRDD